MSAAFRMRVTSYGLLTHAIFFLGRNFILYSKGFEPDDVLKSDPADIEGSCEKIGMEYKLSPREREVLKELTYGHASSYVAKVLYISNNTAGSHIEHL